VALETLFCHCKGPSHHILKHISTANSMKVCNSHIIESFMVNRWNRVFLCNQLWRSFIQHCRDWMGVHCQGCMFKI